MKIAFNVKYTKKKELHFSDPLMGPFNTAITLKFHLNTHTFTLQYIWCIHNPSDREPI